MSDRPKHLAVIPDGNRRWARHRGKRPEDGHRAGIKVVGDIAECAWREGVEVFSFWWGSPANLKKRSASEVAAIIEALNEWLQGPCVDLLSAHGAQFEIHGRWRQLCPELDVGVNRASAAAGSGKRKLVVLMAYDGHEEILAAVNRVSGNSTDQKAFSCLLWTGHLPPVDLLIRCGGEPHLSAGFMLWSLGEAQMSWPTEMWPEFSAERLREILADYAETERRFGA